MSHWRLILPTLQGFVALLLMVWEQHNSRVIESMGMAWDTGAPMWPFQTPEILLVILDAPAYLLAAPICAIAGFRTIETRHPVILAALILVWFLVGWSMDFSLILKRWARKPKTLLLVFLTTGTFGLYASIYLAIDGIRWWFRYGGFTISSLLIFLRAVGPLPWCALIAVVSARNLLRMFRPKPRT